MLTPKELEDWISKRTAESAAETGLHIWDWQAMCHLKAERDELRAELAALTATPDNICWKQLVAFAYQASENGAHLIERITAEYNRMKAERDHMRDTLADARKQLADAKQYL